MPKEQSPSSPEIHATVQASAGTGKTWLLVTRLVRLLLHGASPDAILAITFTRKAAAEMQSRLSERLLDLAAADEAGLKALLQQMEIEPDEATTLRARHLYEDLLKSGKSVRTTTFHAFCQEILRRFPLEADVPPGFELLEGSGELMRAAWDALMEEVTLRPDTQEARAMEGLLDYCGGLHGLRQGLDAFLSHRGDWWAFTELSDDPLGHARQQLRQQLDIDEDAEPLVELFTPQLEQQLAEFVTLLGKHLTATNEKHLQLLADARDPQRPLTVRFTALRPVFLTQSNEPLKSRKESKVQAQKMGASGEARFLDLHRQLSQSLITTLDRQASLTTLRACNDWYLAGSALLDHYQRLKGERRQLDFTDLEWRAYRLLNLAESAQWVQYKLDQRIEHLLVDEFQDTNPTQWRLLLPLLQEMASGSDGRQRSVFLVGDAKQSIYRFRRAEPRLFQAAHEWLVQHLGAQGFPLHTSWRSAPAIMEYVNRVFDKDGPMAGMLRDFSPHDTYHHGLWGSVTVLPLVDAQEAPQANEELPPEGLRNPLHHPRTLLRDDRYLREGMMIAAEIERLVAQQTPIGTGEQARPLRYADIMLLVRSRAHVGSYEQALREHGIPYLGAERGTLLESLEVRDMVALLEVLITPYNNLSVATVLRSPLFCCSDAALLELAALERGSWFERLAAVAALEPQGAIAHAWSTLSAWQQLAGQVPIHDLLDRIYNEGNVLARYQAAFPEHLRGRVQANLTRFLELALQIDSGRYPSLGHFLARLGEMRERRDEAPDEAPTLGHNDRVRIMTIHASKGLEAPLLFLADTTHSSSRERPFRALVEWPAEAARPHSFLLVGKKGQQPPLIREALEREQREERREDANLLYVALTRARQLLYISGCEPGRGSELGWYAPLRQALMPAEDGANTPCTLETGVPPVLISAARQTPELTKLESLSSVLPPHSSRYELAPSRHPLHGLQRGEAGDEDGRQRGIVIHRLLERLVVVPPPQHPGVISEVAAEFGLSPSQSEMVQWSGEVERLLENRALAPIFYPEGESECFNEVPVIYLEGGCTVHGLVDRLLLFAEEVWVVDYKTHRGVSAGNVVQQAESFRRQLDYYGEGVRRLWPQRQVRRFVLFTHSHTLYEFT